MYRTISGEEVFVMDCHSHLWDASPANQLNKYGRGWIDCFYAYHKNLSPPDYVWPLEKYEKYPAEDMVHDQFVKGYVDLAILQPTYLIDFYKNGFNTIEQNSVMKKDYPDRYILNGAWDARDGEAAWSICAVRRASGISRASSSTPPNGAETLKATNSPTPKPYRYFEECVKLGITNIHVHKGPTIYPLNRDAFDVADVDDAASVFTELNFIVEHAGLPRIEDFCWIATQESNVYAGLAVVLPFIHSRPRYFAEVMANLMFWIGPDKILFGSDYAIWEPKWLVERLMAFEMPEDLKAEYGAGTEMTMEVKRKILGLNAARLYGIDPDAQMAKIEG